MICVYTHTLQLERTEGVSAQGNRWFCFCSVSRVLSLLSPVISVCKLFLVRFQTQHGFLKFKKKPVGSSAMQFGSQLPLIAIKVPFKWECLEGCASPGW